MKGAMGTRPSASADAASSGKTHVVPGATSGFSGSPSPPADASADAPPIWDRGELASPAASLKLDPET